MRGYSFYHFFFLLPNPFCSHYPITSQTPINNRYNSRLKGPRAFRRAKVKASILFYGGEAKKVSQITLGEGFESFDVNEASFRLYIAQSDKMRYPLHYAMAGLYTLAIAIRQQLPTLKYAYALSTVY
jgi:hypothetical protein